MTAVVSGHPLWFETDDAQLVPSPEAFAGPLLIPALELGVGVRVDTPLDAQWLANTADLLPILARWWGYGHHHPMTAESVCTEGRTVRGTGLCFTAGVDSFYSLLHGQHAADVLVFVHGYDIALDDHRRMDEFARSLRQVAAEYGKRAVILRSNLRRHPLCAAVSWQRTHGAALAAAGHLLTGILDTLVIPASYKYADEIPWGSNWRTDPLWSSARLRVLHDDAALARRDKIPLIAGEPILWQHLRVCWENRSPTGNCSRCEKCLRTMVSLAICGRLANYAVFDRNVSLPRALDSLTAVPEGLLVVWEELAGRDLEPELKAAVVRLVQRSRERRRRSRLTVYLHRVLERVLRHRLLDRMRPPLLRLWDRRAE
ncbi:MAG TPA: hypothetical protein VMS86_14045 [Thermoanaerobaculia bacterium]|nr:hypothetical protein [Thermoanaerobaculia bacterium]